MPLESAPPPEPGFSDARTSETLSPAAPPTRGPLAQSVFFDSDGLRAGWRVPLYMLLAGLLLLVCYLLVSIVQTALHLRVDKTPGLQPGLTSISDGVLFGCFVGAARILSRLEQRPFASYGLAPVRAVQDLLAGLGWGFVHLNLLVLGLLATHAIAVDGIAERGLPALASAGEWLIAFLLVGLAEEFLFRGYLQFTLAQGFSRLARRWSRTGADPSTVGFWIAAALLSVGLFTVTHLGNPGETAPGIVGVGLAGLVLVFSLWRTGTLWWAVGWHCAWDWSQTCLFGTADSGNVARQHLLNSHPVGPVLLSGGSAGPEGSVLVLPVLLAAALTIHLTLPRRAQRNGAVPQAPSASGRAG